MTFFNSVVRLGFAGSVITALLCAAPMSASAQMQIQRGVVPKPIVVAPPETTAPKPGGTTGDNEPKPDTDKPAENPKPEAPFEPGQVQFGARLPGTGISMEEEDDQPTSVVEAQPIRQTSQSAPVVDDKTVCCRGFYGEELGLMTRSACRRRGGDAMTRNSCSAPDVEAERGDAAGFAGARDMGDLPRLSPGSPVNQASCSNGSCSCDTGDNGAGDCDDIHLKCSAIGKPVVECTFLNIGNERQQFCKC